MGDIVPAERFERALRPIWAVLAVEAGQLARGVLASWWDPAPAAAEGHEQESCPEVVCGACPDVSCAPCSACPAPLPCPATPDQWLSPESAGAGATAVVATQVAWRFVKRLFVQDRRGHGAAPARRGGGVVA